MSIRKEQDFMQEMLPEAKAKREAALKRLAEDVGDAAHPRKPLCEAQIDTLWLQRDCFDAIKAGDILAQVRSFARAIEAAHGIGEEGK